MSTVEKSIRLYAWKTNYQTFRVVQGEDDSRKFNIQLFSTTIPVDLTNCSVKFFAVKPDQTKVYVNCDVIDADNGLVSLTLNEQICAVEGIVDCWVQVIGDGGTDLRFEGLSLEVSVCGLKGAIEETESVDDMKAFLQESARLAAVEELLENTPYTTAESEGEFELPVHTINDSEISDYSTWSSKKIIDAIYPIGTIYMSVNNVNPSELLGGTWVAWGAGRVPVGVDASDSDFNSVEKTGGNKNLQKHSHTTYLYNPSDAILRAPSGKDGIQVDSYAGSVYSKLRDTTCDVGNGDSGNLQPYITCYMWKRTA